MELLHQEEKNNISTKILHICFYLGSILLTLFLVEYGFVSDLFPFLRQLNNPALFANMLAVFVATVALISYVDEDNKKVVFSYLLMIAICVVTVSVFGNGAVNTFMLFIPLFVAAFGNPLAERMKKILTVFFMEAFLFANMSLLFNYTEWIHTQGAVYSLESSVIGEMILALFALVVTKEFDKLSEGEDISRVRLCTLRKKCRKALLLSGCMIGFAIILCWDMGVMGEEFSIIFNKANGIVAPSGIFTNVVTKFIAGVNKGITIAFLGNVFGLFSVSFGIVGVLVVAVIYIYLAYILYRHLKYGKKEKDAWDLVAVVGLIQFIVQPVCMEMVIFWSICIFACAVRETGWKLHIIRFFKEKNLSQEENESGEQEMNNSGFIE